MGCPFRNVLVAVLLASKAVLSGSVVVEASNVTNIEVVASGWDLRPAADGGCGIAGCDPRLTRDGQDNTVPDSRWSCKTYVSTGNLECSITFGLDSYYEISHLMFYFHESENDTEVAIPFTVNGIINDITTSGLPLGEGQRVKPPGKTSSLSVVFDLTNDQWIHLSEVEIFLIVEDPGSIVVLPAPTRSIVNAKTVTNVYGYASNWDLRGDAGCGEAGCDPRFVTDGENNTVASSRWSCTVDPNAEYSNSDWSPSYCNLALIFDDSVTISHVMIYMHESDDAAKASMSMTMWSATCSAKSDCLTYSPGWYANGILYTVPGTPLGSGQRVNFARPSLSGIAIVPNITSANSYSVDISEVEVFVEVTQTDVEIVAREAWQIVTAEAATTVTASATGSIDGFGPGKTTDGHNNTVATSYWSCSLTLAEYSSTSLDDCAIFFTFGDEYIISYFVLYVHESDDVTKDPIQFSIYDCVVGVDYFCFYNGLIGTYSTTPGTPLGVGERFNLIRPYTSKIYIGFNMTGQDAIDVSEVEFFLDVPDGTPTPSPFSTPAPTTPSPVVLSPNYTLPPYSVDPAFPPTLAIPPVPPVFPTSAGVHGAKLVGGGFSAVCVAMSLLGAIGAVLV